MAKALYAARIDPRLLAEISSLRARVAELQRENDALRLENSLISDSSDELAEVAPVVLA